MITSPPIRRQYPATSKLTCVMPACIAGIPLAIAITIHPKMSTARPTLVLAVAGILANIDIPFCSRCDDIGSPPAALWWSRRARVDHVPLRCGGVFRMVQPNTRPQPSIPVGAAATVLIWTQLYHRRMWVQSVRSKPDDAARASRVGALTHRTP